MKGALEGDGNTREGQIKGGHGAVVERDKWMKIKDGEGLRKMERNKTGEKR